MISSKGLIKNIQPFTPPLRKPARLNASRNTLPVIEQAIGAKLVAQKTGNGT